MNTASNRYSQGQGRSVTKRLANENDPTAKRPRKQRGSILSQQSVQSAGSSNSRAVKTPTSKEILSDNQVGILEPAIVVKLVAHVILEVVQTTRIDHVIHGRFSNVVIDEEYNVNAPENAKVKKHPSFFIMIITINRVNYQSCYGFIFTDCFCCKKFGQCTVVGKTRSGMGTCV